MEDQHYDPVTGDAIQRTTHGLLVWEKMDDRVTFTDGYHTWIDGPFGIVMRLNSERFPWETGASPAPSLPHTAPITNLRIPKIALSEDVVPMPFIDDPLIGRTWAVPAFKVGWGGATTAGAGEPGNAVLFGHNESIGEGNVFRDLDQLEVGDRIELFSGSQRFVYRVTWVEDVSYNDVSVTNPTPFPTVTLITCAGKWAPSIQSFASRLVVVGQLVVSREQ